MAAKSIAPLLAGGAVLAAFLIGAKRSGAATGAPGPVGPVRPVGPVGPVGPSIPVPPNPAAAVGQQLAASLNATLASYGSLTKAKGHEDKALVSRFQALVGGLKVDGLYGANTRAALARYVSADELPPIFYQPRA